MGVSGSKFSTTPKRNAPPIKNRAKFHKIYSKTTISDIISGEADKERSRPRPSSTIK